MLLALTSIDGVLRGLGEVLPNQNFLLNHFNMEEIDEKSS